MGYVDDKEKAHADLAKLGSTAVEILRKRMLESGSVGDAAFAAAQDVLDRLGIRRTV